MGSISEKIGEIKIPDINLQKYKLSDNGGLDEPLAGQGILTKTWLEHLFTLYLRLSNFSQVKDKESLKEQLRRIRALEDLLRDNADRLSRHYEQEFFFFKSKFKKLTKPEFVELFEGRPLLMKELGNSKRSIVDKGSQVRYMTYERGKPGSRKRYFGGLLGVNKGPRKGPGALFGVSEGSAGGGGLDDIDIDGLDDDAVQGMDLLDKDVVGGSLDPEKAQASYLSEPIFGKKIQIFRIFSLDFQVNFSVIEPRLMLNRGLEASEVAQRAQIHAKKR